MIRTPRFRPHADENRVAKVRGPEPESWRLLRSPLAICIAACLTLHSCSRPSDSPTEIVFWAFGAEGEHVQSLIPGFEGRES